MKLLKTILSGLTLYQEDMTLNFTATQRVSTEAREHLNQIADNIFANPVIELAGLNGSGKTMTLKVMMLVFAILNGDKLNTLPDKELYLGLINQEPISVKSYFLLDDEFYTLVTKLGKRKAKRNLAEELYISEEKLFIKKSGARVTKSSWEADPNQKNGFYRLLMDRKEADDFLSDDISLNVSLVNRRGPVIVCSDFQEPGNPDVLVPYGECLPEVIQFLDPGIEYLKTGRTEGTDLVRWLLKFKHRDKIYTLDSARDWECCLSKGTVRGMRLFMSAASLFNTGGYLVIDELENHLNLKVVKCLLELFQNQKINQAGAAILFSTHYPELLDVPERNDAVYILSNEGKITCENLSLLKPRNDGMKASQAFMQNLFAKATAPSYQSFTELKKALSRMECELNDKESER